MSKDRIKAVGLLSGGLDSTLAVKLMIEQGIEVTVMNFITPFCTCTRKGCKHEATRIAKEFGVEIKVISGGKEFIKMIQNPKHGYGRNMNPCIDCRIFLFKKAKSFMEENGAHFIFTGEVLGQRPMSQHTRAMKLIEEESDLQKLVVRPLSAKLLEPTIPEEKKWIDIEKMMSIQGRRRIPQMELAKDFGIRDYPCPAGGCRLTDPQFSKRLKESFDHNEHTIREIQLLKYGRHFRLKSGAKVVVGRNEEENKNILKFSDLAEAILEVIGAGSPIVLLKNKNTKDDILEAARLCVRYSDIEENECADVQIKYSNKEEILTISL